MIAQPLEPCRDVLLLRSPTFRDTRGSFRELFHRERLLGAGVSLDPVQVNHSRSLGGVLRGLHFQHPRGQAKLLAVTSGRIFDVAVDVRAGSGTFGRWVGHELTAEGGEQMFVPEGFAHGFLVLSEVADVVYACSTPYDPSAEHCLAWDDERLGIPWPLAAPEGSALEPTAPMVSARDRRGSSLSALEAAGVLPRAATGPRAP